MKRHLLLTALLAFFSATILAQVQDGQIVSENLSRSNSVFRTAGDWACVVVMCNENHPLVFTSEADGRIQENFTGIAESAISKSCSALLYDKRTEGGYTRYYFRFRTGKKYDNRVLRVTSRINHSFVNIPLYGLEKKSEHQYRIYDREDVEDLTPYDEHKLLGLRNFQQRKYTVAKNEYLLASQCYDITEQKREAAKTQMLLCDTIMALMAEGNQAAKEERYDEAAEIFLKAYFMNPNDEYLGSRYTYCARKQRNLCSFYAKEADRSFAEKDFETALHLYQEVEENGCGTPAIAQRIKDCQSSMRKRENTERYFGIEVGGHLPGFTVGGFRHKVGASFTLRTNGSMFSLMRTDYKLGDTPGFDIALGPTIPLIPKKVLTRQKRNIFRGAWLNVGIGLQGGACYQLRKGVADSDEWRKYMPGIDATTADQGQLEQFLDLCKQNSEEDYKGINDILTPRLGFSAGADLGLTVKIWRVAVRGTYHFRAPVYHAKPYIDNLGRQQFTFGIGWCW